MDRSQETGDRSQETGDRRQELEVRIPHPAACALSTGSAHGRAPGAQGSTSQSHRRDSSSGASPASRERIFNGLRSGPPSASKPKLGMGSKQFDKLTMESSAAKPATCSTKEDLQRAVEAARTDYERHSRLLRGEANYTSLRSQADEARLKWQGARLALACHIVEHGCSKPSGARWKYL
jgi:hypothetical protein